MPVELNIIESVTTLDTTIVTVELVSASEPGPAGPGVPTGGTAGQVLTKDSGTDYDTSWQDATGGGGGAPTDGTYLVTTAHDDLSDEVVVGATPGGELGGTWASPTVDASHSGSTHAAVQAAAEATAAAALASHEGDTTSIHGIADTSALALTASHPTNATFNDHSARHENGGADEISIAGLDGTPTELTNHLNDTSAAHAASAISADSGTLVGTGTDVQAVLEELDNGIADHLADSSAAHAASAISFSPTGSISATDVQAAIAEVASEAAGGGAPTDATYITQTANGSLSNEQALSALSTGLVKVTNATGVLSTAVANTDYPAVTHASRHENGGADEINIGGLDGTPTELTNHLNDAADAHDASAISVADAGGFFTGTDVEAALQELGPMAGWTEIVKQSDESVANTTLQNDDELVFATVNGAVYEIQLTIIYTSPVGAGTPDLKVAFGEDSTIRGTMATFGINASNAASSGNVLGNQTGTAAHGTTAANFVMQAFGAHVAAGGTWAFQWAQNTSNANNVTVKAGSILRYRRIL